ncbi:hypothetical protein [Proteiniborus sp. MB09-C3]|uniref:coiled-coil domain-containing protein n=1 Tax=Proteiniborus sp. MB09-C3 TaxID=3050072 RepID=UPI00255372B3|nr:hypothetical protein [Proteiniborus sp. MB09-C3]WIV13808.1 hypothetical protein QO263_08955 [Proteiniborus sp. MB09-C3]
MRKLMYLGLIFSMIAGLFITSIVAAAPDEPNKDKSLSEIHESLTGVSEEEKEVLEKLFLLSQDIEEMDRKKGQILKEIESLNEEVKKIENLIEAETLSYEENLSIMENVLKNYQRSGPGSFIELILSSDNLKILLQRLNALGDITRNTNRLLESLQESKAKLDTEKNRITNKLILAQKQQEELEETLEKSVALKEELEVQLTSLEGERTKYEEYLIKIDQYWSQLKPLFAETVSVFSNMLHDSSIPPDAIKIEFSILSVKGIIEEKTFKEIIAEQSFPTKLELEFSSDKLELIMPDENLHLVGDFAIVDGKKLIFEVDEGSFFGMPLEKATIEDLFSDGYMELDLEQVLGKNKLKSIKINDDNIELQITPVFF